jgi:hypothetical protein
VLIRKWVLTATSRTWISLEGPIFTARRLIPLLYKLVNVGFGVTRFASNGRLFNFQLIFGTSTTSTVEQRHTFHRHIPALPIHFVALVFTRIVSACLTCTNGGRKSRGPAKSRSSQSGRVIGPETEDTVVGELKMKLLLRLACQHVNSQLNAGFDSMEYLSPTQLPNLHGWTYHNLCAGIRSNTKFHGGITTGSWNEWDVSR